MRASLLLPGTVFALTLLGAAAGAQNAPAQNAPAPTPPVAAPLAQPAAPGPRAETARRLDELFARLREAPNERAARALEREIGVHLARSPSDTTNLLMARVAQAFERQDYDLSLALIDAVIDLDPDYVEGRHRRATIYFMRREYGRALIDIEEVLKREPRHFAAMGGLGMIFQQIGDDKSALAVFRKALELHPHMERIPDIVKRLAPAIDGRDL